MCSKYHYMEPESSLKNQKEVSSKGVHSKYHCMEPESSLKNQKEVSSEGV